MAIDVDQLRLEATNAVLSALTDLYENSDSDAMKDFAEVIAEAAVATAQHVLNQAQTELSGEGIL